MKKQILLIVMTLCAVSAMAVSLPSRSYNLYSATSGNTEPYTLGIGTRFMNSSVVGAYYESGCKDQGLNQNEIVCTNCCAGVICNATDEYDILDCEADTPEAVWGACMSDCRGEHLNYQEPLDAPVFFLLALIAAYGAFAVYRRKMQEV
jgi:hypothetical protein